MRYVPERGDIAWVDFDAPVGHEQGGRRPALVLSPRVYNERTGLALVVPTTSQVKGYPFEVSIPAGSRARGAVLCDQVRTVDWRRRGVKRLCPAPAGVLDATIEKVLTLVAIGA